MIVHLYRGLDISELRRVNQHLRIHAKAGKYLVIASRGEPARTGGRTRVTLKCCSCDIISADGKSRAIARGWEVSKDGRTATCPDCARFAARHQ